LPVVSTSAPSSKNSSQIAGVTPKPPAAFSTLITSSSALLLSTRCCTCSRTILRPGLPKTSPMKRICTCQDNSELCTCVSVHGLAGRGRPAVHFRRSFRELCFSEKVVVPRRIGMQVLHPRRMHNDVIQRPEIKRWQITQRLLLDLRVEL